jgi:hypothetical protein
MFVIRRNGDAYEEFLQLAVFRELIATRHKPRVPSRRVSDAH